MILLLAWIGAAGISAAPFIINTAFGKGLAIFSLACLSVQAVEKRLWNLVAMNTIGILGYCYVLFF